MPTSTLERLLRRLGAPIFWLPFVMAFGAAVTFGKAFGPVGALAGIVFGLVLGLGLGIAWHWLMHVRTHQSERDFAERTIAEAQRTEAQRAAADRRPPVARTPSPPDLGSSRDARAAADEALAMLAEGQTGAACLGAARAIQMAVLAEQLDVALEVWDRFAEHREQLMLEPSTARRLAEAEAQRRRGRSG